MTGDSLYSVIIPIPGQAEVFTLSHLPTDYHTHNYLCKHATGAPLDYAIASQNRGLPGIACTDHCPTNDGFGSDHRMDLEVIDFYKDLVASAQAINDTVLFGIEADYYPGCTAWLKPWLKAQNFDIVLGAVHFIDGWDVGNEETTQEWKSVDVKGVWHRYFKLVQEMVETGIYGVVAHLDLPKKCGFRPSSAAIREMVLPVLDAIKLVGMAMEINTSGKDAPCSEFFPSGEIISLAVDRTIPIVFGSDAHSPEMVGYAFEEAMQIAKEAGCTETLEVTTGSMRQL